jgi:hypothetical protein
VEARGRGEGGGWWRIYRSITCGKVYKKRARMKQRGGEEDEPNAFLTKVSYRDFPLPLFILSQLVATYSFEARRFSPLAVYMVEGCRSKGSYGREK